MKHRVFDVLVGVGMGLYLTYPMPLVAETYIKEEPVVEVKTEIVKEKTIEEKVREAFADVPIMIEIARCESTFKNVPGRLSDDYGPFQINWVHLEEMEKLGLDRTVVEDNIAFARILYNRAGTQPWYSSEDCWNK